MSSASHWRLVSRFIIVVRICLNHYLSLRCLLIFIQNSLESCLVLTLFTSGEYFLLLGFYLHVYMLRKRKKLHFFAQAEKNPKRTPIFTLRTCYVKRTKPSSFSYKSKLMLMPKHLSFQRYVFSLNSLPSSKVFIFSFSNFEEF